MFPVLLLMALLTASAPAAEAAEPAPPSAAAGVLEISGRRGCSAVLIAPDLVATAAHCLGNQAFNGEGEPTARFHTGSYPGHASTSRRLSRGYRHPLYRPDAAAVRERLAADIALARLETPFRPEEARPIPLGAPAAMGERLLIASWPLGRGERARERRCATITVGPRVATLSCVVVSGESGAPVLRLTEEGPELAAILVAKSRAGHQPFAFSVQATARIRQLSAIYLD